MDTIEVSDYRTGLAQNEVLRARGAISDFCWTAQLRCAPPSVATDMRLAARITGITRRCQRHPAGSELKPQRLIMTTLMNVAAAVLLGVVILFLIIAIAFLSLSNDVPRVGKTDTRNVASNSRLRWILTVFLIAALIGAVIYFFF
jgi:hypothetical protein